MSNGQFKPNLMKLSTNEPNKMTSPKVSRRNESQTNIKISQNEVEEKLKNMELKRMSRLGSSSVDQRGLAGVRDKWEEEYTEVSIGKLGEKKVTGHFKKAVEEITRQNKVLKTESTKEHAVSSKIKEEMVKYKPSTTKKFINSFNCAVNSDAITSGEDNELDIYSKRKDDIQKESNAIEEENDLRYSQLHTTNLSSQTNLFQRKTPLVSKGGFEAMPPDLILTTSGSDRKNIELPLPSQENDTEKSERFINAKDQNIRSDIHPGNPEISDGKEINKKKQDMGSEIHRHSSNSSESIRGPLPLSREITREAKVFKKLQRGCKIIDEILKDHLEVDLEEINDLKTTLDEAAILLSDYQRKLKILEEKVSPNVFQKRKLAALKSQLNKVKDDVKNFRGLKRDLQYIQISTILSNFYLEINNIFNKLELGSGNGRKELLTEVDTYIQELEVKAVRNEQYLFEILTEQVETIGNKYFAKVIKSLYSMPTI